MTRLIAFLKPYRKECIIGPIFKLLEAILELLLPTLMALVINHGVAQRDLPYVLKMGGLMLFMALAGFGSSLICQYYAARASQGFGTTLRNAMFEQINRLSYAEIDRFGTASLINRITNDVNQLQLAVAMLIRLVIRAPFICAGALVMAMILDIQLSLVLLAAAPIFAAILYVIIRLASPLYRRYQEQLDRLGRLLGENLAGVRVIRAFARTGAEQERFATANDDLTGTALRVARISALLSPLTSLVMNAAIIAILWVGGIHINAGRLAQGEIIAFVNYITQMLLALIVVSNLVILFTKAFASAGRVEAVLAATPDIADPPSGRTAAPGPRPDAPFIEFDRVSFGYSRGGDQALTDISLVIRRGETVGVIGGTGSGKSTLVNLLPRFYEVTAGAIRIAGVDVRDYPLRRLREQIGVVPQQAVLFSGTVAENIRWGKSGASDAEVAEAARIAQADEFIARLPGGYDARVERGGRNFSGGQKQRLTIARALVGRPAILILDDSASALDFATDAALRRAIKGASGGTTVFLVSQRASTIRQADRIIVLDDGRIVGQGSHQELLKQCQIYREICLSQLSQEEVGA